MFLALHGMKSGYWTDVASSPLAGGYKRGLVDAQPADAPEVAVAVPAGQPEAEQPPRTVKESNRELEKLRKQGRNNIELCVIILSNMVTKRLMHVLRLSVKPIRVAFGKEEVKAKTRSGTLEMYMSWSLGGYNVMLGEVFAVLDDARALATMGFRSPSDGQPSAGELAEDVQVAERLLQLIVNLVGSRLETMLYYSHCVPGMFVQLLSKDDAVVKAALEQLKAIWAWLMDAEAQSVRLPAVLLDIQNIPWRSWVYVRETFILLEEAEFKHVPAEVHSSLMGLFTGMLH